MVRAGVVSHPVEWAHSGYREIQEPPKRYAVIDLEGLAALCVFNGYSMGSHLYLWCVQMKRCRDSHWCRSPAPPKADCLGSSMNKLASCRPPLAG